MQCGIGAKHWVRISFGSFPFGCHLELNSTNESMGCFTIYRSLLQALHCSSPTRTHVMVHHFPASYFKNFLRLTSYLCIPSSLCTKRGGLLSTSLTVWLTFTPGRFTCSSLHFRLSHACPFLHISPILQSPADLSSSITSSGKPSLLPTICLDQILLLYIVFFFLVSHFLITHCYD